MKGVAKFVLKKATLRQNTLCAMSVHETLSSDKVSAQCDQSREKLIT